MKRNGLLIVAFLLFSPALSAQADSKQVSVGFWNVENLYDTLPSPFGKDSEFTPSGARNWTAERYTTKLGNLAQVLDQMNLDVVGLCEVESELAVRDLVMTLSTDYNYVHHTSTDWRGMDLGLLYKGDKFVVDHSRLVASDYGREFLYVRGELYGERIDLIVCHLPSNFNSTAQRDMAMASLAKFAHQLRDSDPRACPIVMGDMNANPTDKAMRTHFGSGKSAMDGIGFLYTPFGNLHRQGLGSYAYNDRWQMYDTIWIDNSLIGGHSLRYVSCGVFVRDYMLGSGDSGGRGYPFRTFSGSRYTGGFSDHLPVYIMLEIF